MLKKSCTALILLLIAFGSYAAPLSAGFTYQGELQVSNAPADGEYDFRFELFDAANLGTSTAIPIIVENVFVSNGLFTTELDFGFGPFAGDQLWLEIGVRDGASGGSFTGLLPRQKLTATPYALHAEFVAAGSITALEIDSNAVQARIGGTCPAGQSIRAIAAAGTVSCEIDTDTTYQTGSGLTLAGTKLNVNTNIIQNRVLGTCPAGESIRSIDTSGAVVCEIDTDTAYTAGTGINLAATRFSVDNNVVQSRIGGSCPVGSFLVGINQDGSVQCRALSVGLPIALSSVNSEGTYTSVAVRDDGRPIISFEDVTNLNLKIYDCSSTDCTAGVFRTLDAIGDVGRYTSIAIRSDGLPMISYFDSSNLALKAFFCSNTACSAGTARTLDVGLGQFSGYTSVAIRGNSLPIISYINASNGSLKVFDCNNSDCSLGTARTLAVGPGITDTSVAIRGNGWPIIAYRDPSQPGLSVYDCGNIGCSSGTARALDISINVGRFNSIAVRDDGRPIISYYDGNNFYLLLYDCFDSACVTGLVRVMDFVGSVGKYTSMKIRASGMPIISYYGATLGGLRVYDCFTTDCSVGVARTLDRPGNVGSFTSLAIRPDGSPIISYRDSAVNNNLKIYSCGDSRCGLVGN